MAFSWLKTIGEELGKDFSKADVIFKKIEPVAEFTCEVLSAINPAYGALATRVLKGAVFVEGQAASVGQATGTGNVKAALVVQLFGTDIADFLKSEGKPSDATAVLAEVNKIVTLFNSKASTALYTALSTAAA